MLPSLHDNFLISYEVSCEARQIEFVARPDMGEVKGSIRIIAFSGVEGYRFENDALGNHLR